MCLDYSFSVVIPNPLESDVSIPRRINLKCAWHTRYKPHEGFDSLHGNSVRVPGSPACAAYVRQENRAREGQMDRSSGAWLRYEATTPDVLRLWIYGSHPRKTHTDNGPKTGAGLLTPSTNVTHPPRDRCTWAAHWEETHKTIKPSKTELIYGIVWWPIRASLSANMTRCLRIGLIGGLPL